MPGTSTAQRGPHRAGAGPVALTWRCMSVGVSSVQEHGSDGEGGDDVAAEEEGVLHPAEGGGDGLVGVAGLRGCRAGRWRR